MTPALLTTLRVAILLRTSPVCVGTAVFMPAHPYPFCGGLGGGDRASSVQKQSHFQSRAHASHSSGGRIESTRMKTALFRNCAGVFSTNSCFESRWEAAACAASPGSRTWQTAHGAGASGGRWCRWPVTAVTQTVPQAEALCLRLLGVAWSPRPDPCVQRDGCSVAWIAAGFAD